MTRFVKGHIIENIKFSSPFRMILAGSSGSGKTFFAGQILRNDLFERQISNVYYYYPCYLDEPPVSWHDDLDVPVTYNVGLPTRNDLLEFPKDSCIVLDDSFDEIVNSSVIDHLFRVISGKKLINVIIMSQNNFSKGKYGRDIRNSCNFSVLFQNCCDTLINKNIARMSGVKSAYNSAMIDQRGSKYPYVFIDQSQQGQMTPYRLYTNIFAEFRTVWSVGGMKGYVVAAQDFEAFFKVKTENGEFIATRNETSKSSKENHTPCNTPTKQKGLKPIKYEKWAGKTKSKRANTSPEIRKAKKRRRIELETSSSSETSEGSSTDIWSSDE